MGRKKLELNRNEVIKAIVKNRGKVHKVAKSLGVSYDGVRRIIQQDEELRKVLQDERGALEDYLLDRAEDTLQFALDCHRSKLSHAIKVAMYLLNAKGDKRGYKNSNRTEVQMPTLDDLKSWAKIKQDDDK